jgi:aquaporin Z
MAVSKPASGIDIPKLIAEFVGTFFLVFFAVGVATLSFGFKFAGTSTSAGVVATALCFGLVLLALAYTLGPISGCHINPAVTLAFLVGKRLELRDAITYWIAQFLGGIAGALVLWGIFSASPVYSRHIQGLGADGFGPLSDIRINAVGAFFTEVILTLLFVYVVLSATSKLMASPALAGLALGLALTVVHLIGIPITGTSVNPARSLGPALIVGGQALSQVWLFIVAPLVGGALAAVLYRYFATTAATAESETAAPPAPAST